MPQGVPGPKWLKVGQIVRRPHGQFGVVVGVYGSTARIKTQGKQILESIYEVQRTVCRDRFAKVFRGDENISAEVFQETGTGTWKLSPTNQHFQFSNRFWWGKCYDQTYRDRSRQLAAVILEKVLSDFRVAEVLCDRFADEVLANLPAKRFFLTEFDVREWAELASAELAAEGSPYAGSC